MSNNSARIVRSISSPITTDDFVQIIENRIGSTLFRKDRKNGLSDKGRTGIDSGNLNQNLGGFSVVDFEVPFTNGNTSGSAYTNILHVHAINNNKIFTPEVKCILMWCGVNRTSDPR
jgi:hypothetical protein